MDTETKAEKARRARLARLFNITPEEWFIIAEHQGGVCAICTLPPGKTRLAVDHDHKTGLVRGLVHWQCNAALAKLKDSSERAFNAYRYLENPPASAALGEPRYGRVGRTTTRAKKPGKRGSK